MNLLERITSTYAEANQLFAEHGLLDQDPPWRFELSNHKGYLGMCYHNRKLIVFSKHYLASHPMQISDTLKHEVAHALVGAGNGHNQVWANMAVKLGAIPQSCAEQQYVVTADGQQQKTVVNTAKPNYRIHCPVCNWNEYRYRLRQSLFQHTCRTCGSQLQIFGK